MAATTTLRKPEKDTAFAHESAKILVDIVRQNKWEKSFGGTSKHLMYEAWQTVGKYYGYTVKTFDATYVEYGAAKGFEAKAVVIDNKTGMEIGGAEAACLTDEPNWSHKPLFQLKSMAQTRAGSKALRQILGFVVALAGFNPTPAEEMTPDTAYIEPSRQIEEFPKNPPLDPPDEEEEKRIDSWKDDKTEAEKFFEGETCTCGTTNRWHKRDCPSWKSPATEAV